MRGSYRFGFRLAAVSLLPILTSALAQTSPQTPPPQAASPPHHETVPGIPRDEQVRRALSAVPEHLRKGLTIYLQGPTGMVLERKGDNGFTCVELGSQKAPAPHCWDREGTETIFKSYFRSAELRALGKTNEEVLATIADEYRTGKLRAPTKPGISYMLSEENFGLGQNWYPPHVMFYSPFMMNREVGAVRETPSGRRLPWILGAGLPGAYVIATNRPVFEKVEPKPLPQTPKAPKDGLPSLLPRDRESELALSAAPEHLRKDATVYVLERGGFVVARAGTNGFSCLVLREGLFGTIPTCYDAEGTRTTLQANLRRAKLREQRKSHEEIDALIAHEYYNGKLQAPAKVSVSFMLSADNFLVDSGTGKLNWYPPHYAVAMPYVKNSDIGALPEHRGSYYLPWIFDEGRPEARAIIVTPDKRQESQAQREAAAKPK